MALKSAITAGITQALRAYVRYVPLPSGKALLYERVIHPYLAWRKYSTTATTVFGASMAVSLPDLIQSRIYFFGVWEPELTRLIQATLSEGDVFVDVGANVGYYSLLAASIVGPAGRVFSVEASPSIFRKLQANVDRNGAANISLFHCAASDREGVLSVYLGGEGNLGTTTTLSSVAAQASQQREADVPAKPLPAIVGVDNLLKARLIKIDVEGAEPSVIKGIGELLGEFGDETEWVMEITPGWSDRMNEDAADLLQRFRDAGYTLYRLRNDYGVGAYLAPTPGPALCELGQFDVQTDIVASKRRSA